MFGVSAKWIRIYSSVIIISMISKATGYFRDAAITARLGASLITDAYVVALLVPEVLFNIFGNSLTANFAPLYFEAQQANRSRAFVSTLFTFYLLLAGLIFMIGFNKTGFLVRIFSSGFSGTAFATTSGLLRIFLVNIFFLTLTYFFLVYLQAHNRFTIPSTIGILFNLAIIAAMYYKGQADPLYILITSTLAGYICQFLIQLPPAFAEGISLPTWRITITPEIKKYFKLSLPVAVLAVLAQLNIAMDNFFASRLAAGSITTLNLGYRVLMGVYSLLITNTMMIIYPALSKSVINKDSIHTAAIIQRVTAWLAVILLPLSLYLFIDAQPVIDVMFRRGAFTAEKSILTASVFRGYIVGLIFYALRDLLLRYCYAENNTLLPMVNGFLNSSLNFIYLVVIVPFMGLPGISVATALSAVSSFLALYLWARRKNVLFTSLRIWGVTTKILLACCVTGIACELLAFPLIAIPDGNALFQLSKIIGRFITFCLIYCIALVILFRQKIFSFMAKQ